MDRYRRQTYKLDRKNTDVRYKYNNEELEIIRKYVYIQQEGRLITSIEMKESRRREAKRRGDGRNRLVTSASSGSCNDEEEAARAAEWRQKEVQRHRSAFNTHAR